MTMETLFNTIKRTYEQTIKEIFEYIELFYNQQSLHSSLDYLRPVEYRIKMKEEFNSRVA